MLLWGLGLGNGDAPRRRAQACLTGALRRANMGGVVKGSWVVLGMALGALAIVLIFQGLNALAR
ncbi:hypothetical protein HRbin29_02362 [bacterium HR29]|nr:hypothetical protein HRbin29_02362 [bacterium HR29]